jgi:hypothetical protein
MTTKWVCVQKLKTPCPICGKPDWCSVSADGTAVHCMRVQSDKPCPKGGWIHKLTGDVVQQAVEVAKKQKPVKKLTHEELELRHKAMLEHNDEIELSLLAISLGVSVQSLKLLGAAWAYYCGAWAFPMRDSRYRMVGMRYRDDTGKKWAMKGSREGLFYSIGAIHPNGIGAEGPLVVCEGPTDTAAIMDCRFTAVGRPSCSGGTEHIVRMIYGRDIVIMSDQDKEKRRPDGTFFHPGQDGAEALARACYPTARTVKVIRPIGYKDAREWLNSGRLSHAVLKAVISNAKTWKP